MSELIGIAGIILVTPIAYLFWQLARLYKPFADENELETAYVIAAIKKHAKSKNIDLDKEIAKENIMKSLFSKRNFRSEVKKEIINDFFGKEEKKKE